MIAAALAFALAAEQAPPPPFRFDPATKADLQRSHIEGDVPPAKVFDRYLARDLTNYFKAQGVRAPSVEYEMLRKGPTQSGTSFPKYYAWVTVRSAGAVAIEGAARLSAIDRKQFEITAFLSRANIAAMPDHVGDIFPTALIAKIQERAAAAAP